MELVAITIIAVWGWHSSTVTWEQYLCAIGLPIVAAAIWGIFRIPNDPNPAPVKVPGIVRLSYELFFFGFSAWALYSLGFHTLSYIMGAITIISYVSGYDWTLKMLRNMT